MKKYENIKTLGWIILLCLAAGFFIHIGANIGRTVWPLTPEPMQVEHVWVDEDCDIDGCG